MGFIIVYEENLATVKIKVYLVAVKANLGNGLTKIIIGVVALITGAIKIVKELIVLVRYKASKLEVFRFAVTGKVRESIRQQQ